MQELVQQVRSWWRSEREELELQLCRSSSSSSSLIRALYLASAARAFASPVRAPRSLVYLTSVISQCQSGRQRLDSHAYTPLSLSLPLFSLGVEIVARWVFTFIRPAAHSPSSILQSRDQCAVRCERAFIVEEFEEFDLLLRFVLLFPKREDHTRSQGLAVLLW